ncbi:MAG TPA: hypothetical protein VFM23_01345 [Gemmatimonadales bacterium]|nr:hypothetical protein [Gemmatimonadales bacterium]
MRRFATIGLVAVAAACTEQTTAPGDCPDFCPGGQIVIHDTIFTAIIGRDSSFRGYLQPYQAEAMAATEAPGVQSRPYFLLDKMITRVRPSGTDTATVPIFADSSRLRITIVRRDKNAANLQLKLYALPVTVDSLETFASLDTYFQGPAVDSVNVSDLLARPLIGDTATVRAWGDSIRTDSAGHVLVVARSDSAFQIYFSLDTLQAPFVVADSGQLAFGVRVASDSAVSVRLGANESVSNGPVIEWFYHFTPPDSVTPKIDSTLRVPSIDNFVFDPPVQPLDSNLAVGGAPSARSLLRVNFPEFLHDSLDVVRATLILVPSGPVAGAPSDSFSIVVRPLLTDLGAKSPMSTEVAGSVRIHPGVVDTVKIELTDLVRSWSIDTSLTTAFILGHSPEAASFTEIRFFSSRTPAFRPALHVTYVKRFPFGEP